MIILFLLKFCWAAPQDIDDKLRADLDVHTPFPTRVRALRTLGGIQAADAEALLIAAASKDGDEIVRAEAIRALGARKTAPSGSVTAALISATQDHEPRVRGAAIASIRRRRDVKAAERLGDLAKADFWLFVRRDAAEAIGEICPAPGVKLLPWIVRNDKEDLDVQRQALASFTRCQPAQAKPLLEEIILARSKLKNIACALLDRSSGLEEPVRVACKVNTK